MPGADRFLRLGVVGVDIEPDAYGTLLLCLLSDMLVQRSEEPSSPVVCMHVHRLYPPQLPIPPAATTLSERALLPEYVVFRSSHACESMD